MTYTTLKTTVAALALTAGTAFAQDTSVSTDVDADVAGTEITADSNTSADVETDPTLKKLQTESAEALDSAAQTASDAADAVAEAADDVAEDTTELADDAASDTPSADAEMTAEGDAEVTADTDVAEGGAAMQEGFSGMVVSDLVGLDVMAADGEELGEIESIVRDGDQIAAIVGVGGFLGLGERDVSVPLSELSRSAEGDLRLSTWTKAEVDARPEVEADAVEMMQPEDAIDSDS